MSAWRIVHIRFARTLVRPLLYTVVVLMASSCSSEMTGEEHRELGEAYGEYLLINHLHPGDSVGRQRALDRHFDTTGFDSSEDLLETIENLAIADPDQLRHVLDSADAYLSRISSGTDGSAAP